MPDIYLNDPVTLRTKRRTFRIEVENPMGTDKMVRYHQEDVLVDPQDNRVSASQSGTLTVAFADLAGTTYEITDPVTGQTVTLSGAAIALWIESDYCARAAAALN